MNSTGGGKLHLRVDSSNNSECIPGHYRTDGHDLAAQAESLASLAIDSGISFPSNTVLLRMPGGKKRRVPNVDEHTTVEHSE